MLKQTIKDLYSTVYDKALDGEVFCEIYNHSIFVKAEYGQGEVLITLEYSNASFSYLYGDNVDVILDAFESYAD